MQGRRVRAPQEFIRTVAGFGDCFVNHGVQAGLTIAEAKQLFELLPFDLRSCFCFQDTLTELWRFDIGSPPITTSNGGRVLGTLHFQEVRVLVKVLRIASQVLRKDRLDQYVARLANRKKFPDVLAEFQPLFHLRDLRGIENEVAGNGKKTIDWLIPGDGKPPLLIEVKSRVKDLIESIESFEFARSLGVNEIPAPHHDPALMLRSCTDKFPTRDPSVSLHCVWIAAHLKQEINETKAAIAQLEQGTIHVVVFGGWSEEASLLGARHEDIEAVAKRLNIRPSEQFLFVRV